MADRSKSESAVIGAGPAGLMAAEVLAQGGVSVTVYEAMPSVGRKFLMAGRGGLNLTHSEALPTFMTRYGGAASRLASSIEALTPQALREWSDALGQPTFVGSSGRVFPKAFKASPLLRAWLRRLDSLGVRFALRHRWTGWNEEGALSFETPDGAHAVKGQATVLALGGASWPRLGSTGAWVKTLTDKGVRVSPLFAANCGFNVAWSDIFRERFAGHPLKGIALSFGGHIARGEAMITQTGIEGGGIYALSVELREAVLKSGQANLHVALRPDLSAGDLITKLSAPRGKQSLSNFLRKALHLSPVAIGLLQEFAVVSGTPLPSLSAERLAHVINAVPIQLDGVASIARAISTAGGISFEEIDENFMIRQWPGVFAAGEMLDWEAPTGGYLLQASFATGAAAGRGVLKWLRPNDEERSNAAR